MIVLYIAAAVVCMLFLALTVVKSMHMFQLNSYKPATHSRWLKNNLNSLMPGVAGAVVAVTLLVLQLNAKVALPVLLAVLALLCVLQLPKKAKKPLVYTPRVNRMLTTIAVLMLIAAVCTVLFFSHWLFLVVVAVFCLIAPLLVLVANTINKPIEKSINQWYNKNNSRLQSIKDKQS